MTSANLCSHRAEKIDTATKIPRLREFIDPVKAQWREDNIRNSLESYASFCELLGLDKAQAYLANRRVHEIEDWGSCSLDAEGLALQNELEERLKVRFQQFLSSQIFRLTFTLVGFASASNQIIPRILCGKTQQIISCIPGVVCSLARRLCGHSCLSSQIP
jgi:hypothetical protein